jgi:hypothetical protein
VIVKLNEICALSPKITVRENATESSLKYYQLSNSVPLQQSTMADFQKIRQQE